MARNKITQILTAPDKGISRTNGVNGVLSLLFRKMLLDLNISPMQWGSLMYAYITDVRNGVPNNKRDQTSIRGNLTKEFARPQMTWKVFCKAVRFLNITTLKITVEASRAGKQYPSVHVVNVNFDRIPIQKFVEQTEEPEIEGESEDEDENELEQLELFDEEVSLE